MAIAISVVVPVYNRAATILSTLDSVAAQTLRPHRLVVVDDGSTDDSAARVAQWLNQHRSRFDGRLLRQPNRGVSAARNHGFAAAGRSSSIAFLDSDDRWPSDFLERTSAALAVSLSAVAATCDREQHGGRRRGPLVQNLASFPARPIVWMLSHGAGIASSTLFRTAAIERRGGFDEKLQTGEDTALFLRLCLDGHWLHVPGRPVVFDRTLTHRGGVEGNLSEKFRDNCRRWARVCEDFFIHGGGDRALSPSVYRRLVGKAWYRAGRELARGGSLIEARECYRAALAWNPWNYKSWQRMAQTYLATGASPSPETRPAVIELPVLAGGSYPGHAVAAEPFGRQRRQAAASA